MKSDIEIAQAAVMKPILEIAKNLDLQEDEIESYGKYKAKINLSVWNRLKDKPNGKLILVTAINPTPAGEGKTANESLLQPIWKRRKSNRCWRSVKGWRKF